ncbi:MAG: hypothetical protein OXC28_06900 [Defluviicoccus sp.]|nr:hypothetical protein [Defluviicoccus sp.]
MAVESDGKSARSDLLPDRRERLRCLVEFVPEAGLPAAERYLKSLVGLDPLIRALVNAPWDDEPVTEEERKLVEEAERDLAAGNSIPHSEVLGRLGLDDEDPDEPVEPSGE